MSDILIRQQGRAGRITLNRPAALNALTHDMCRALDAALISWANDPGVALVVIDAVGDKAFCAGGDVAELYAHGSRGDYGFGRAFWRDEYRMNARIGSYPKPVISLIHGFCMGGGVGVACHASIRVVAENVQIAMPECAIGLVPDVGGTALLARAPGRLGPWLGLTGGRMGPADAIFAGFADVHVPQAAWPDMIAALCATGDFGAVGQAAQTPPAPSRLATLLPQIDRAFTAPTLQTLRQGLLDDPSDFATETLKAIDRASPLSMATTLAVLRQLGPTPTLTEALELEYRVTFRAQQDTDFLEGIRAMIIDEDRTPTWRHSLATGVPNDEVRALLAPLGPDTLTFTE